MATLTNKSVASTYTSLLKLEGNTGSTVAGAAGDAVQVKTGDNDATPLYLNTDRVGIGTAAPGYALHIKGGSANTFLAIDNAADGYDSTLLFRQNDGTKGLVSYDDSSNTMSFIYGTDPSATTGIHIDSAGKVGIGTAAPASKLLVRNDDDFLSATVHVLHVMDHHGTVDAGDVLARFDFSNDDDVDGAKALSFHDSGGEIGSISMDGDATAFNTSSDYRLKTDLKDIVDATGTINQLKLYDFAWKKNTSKRLTGVIAHEAVEIVPYAVVGDKDAMVTEEAKNAVLDDDGNVIEEAKDAKEVVSPQGVDYSKFVPLLLKAIQELSAKVTALESA